MQAINVGRLLHHTGSITMTITTHRTPYGTFVTHLNNGAFGAVHIPSGGCVAWTKGSWSGEHLHEKLLATISGRPGPINSTP